MKEKSTRQVWSRRKSMWKLALIYANANFVFREPFLWPCRVSRRYRKEKKCKFLDFLIYNFTTTANTTTIIICLEFWAFFNYCTCKFRISRSNNFFNLSFHLEFELVGQKYFTFISVMKLYTFERLRLTTKGVFG